MTEPTKEELQKKIDELQGQVQSLRAQGEGWLITAPSPAYDGQAYGIQFVNGQAFIRKGQKVAAFEIEPAKETTFTKLGLTHEEIARIREREKIPSCERAAMAMQNEFGYLVEYYDANRLEELQKRQSDRVIQRQQVEAMQEQMGEKIVSPHYMTR